MPPDHWTTATNYEGPAGSPGTRRNSRHYEPIVINLRGNLRLGSANQLVKSQRGSYNINKDAS